MVEKGAAKVKVAESAAVEAKPVAPAIVAEKAVVDKTLAFNDWLKIELRVGLIESVEDIVGKDKLYKLSVDFGAEGKRTILAGLKQYYSKEELSGKKTIFVFNLASRKMAGMESQGMILAAKNNEGKFKVIFIDESVPQGTKLE